MDINNTMKIDIGCDRDKEVRDILSKVYESLTVKGYNPINQIVGYIMSGDPGYITGYNGARSLIVKVERDELLEALVKFYIDSL